MEDTVSVPSVLILSPSWVPVHQIDPTVARTKNDWKEEDRCQVTDV